MDVPKIIMNVINLGSFDWTIDSLEIGPCPKNSNY